MTPRPPILAESLRLAARFVGIRVPLSGANGPVLVEPGPGPDLATLLAARNELAYVRNEFRRDAHDGLD
jgi:hypothetical protein